MPDLASILAKAKNMPGQVMDTASQVPGLAAEMAGGAMDAVEPYANLVGDRASAAGRSALASVLTGDDISLGKMGTRGVLAAILAGLDVQDPRILVEAQRRGIMKQDDPELTKYLKESPLLRHILPAPEYP
ncbi:MAG: hypothetical protein F4145_16665 [Boseongicola sp. SB0675_bin_26]|nr:hypothetical protein [Boseongicola sp. SB0675_bin_26]